MQDFSNIKKGQKLLQKIKEAGFINDVTRIIPTPWYKALWKEVFVEKTSTTSYWVDGVKYRKSDRGNQHRNPSTFNHPIFYFPFDENGDPIVLSTEEEVEQTAVLFGKIEHLIKSRPSSCYYGMFMDLKGVDLKTASELAEKIQQASRKLDEAVSELRQLARDHTKT